MSEDISTRLEQAIRDEEHRASERVRVRHEGARAAEEKFEPVRQAAEELCQELASAPNIKVTVNPDSVWITLADRELSLWYKQSSERFAGEESAHSWYDGEACKFSYEWESAEDCIGSLIRLCARYVLMDRAIRASAPTG